MDTTKIVLKRQIMSWDEGLPLGNGEMGCLLFGNSKNLVFSLDRGDVWDKTRSPENNEGFTMKRLLELKEKRNVREISRIFDLPYNKPTPTKLPMGKLLLNMGGVKGDNFELDITQAEAKYSNEKYTLSTFVHATKKVGMIKTNCLEDIKLINPKFGVISKWDKYFERFTVKNATSNKLKNVKYPKAEFNTISNDGIEYEYYIQKLNDGSCYGVCVAKKRIENQMQFAYYASLGNDPIALKEMLADILKKALDKGYDELFVTHKKWWEDYHSKSSIKVPDDFVQRCYYMGNYLLGSASRVGHYPIPLQALWTASDDKLLPPWKGDYHSDLNTQLTYYSFAKSNHLEQGKCFIDFLVKLIGRGKEFAKKFFDADGMCLPSVMDIDGYALGGWVMYSLGHTNQIWLCQTFDKYYSYTGDLEFLKSTAYPYLEQTAKFILSIVKKNEKGEYVLPFSASPEMHNNSLKAFMTPNTNYDLSLMRYLFITLIRFAKILNVDCSEWENALNNLADLAINEKNQLKLSPDEDIVVSHRHQSHAMAIHPLRLLNYYNKEDRAVIDATLDRAIELGTKEYVGYSFAWLAEFCTVARRGDKALEYLTNFWKYFCLENTFHVNGDYTKQGLAHASYRPFTIEGNFCAIDALQEMLLYSENGFVEVFPTLPTTWKDVEFCTLRAFGGMLISAKMSNGIIEKIEILAEQNVTFNLYNKLIDYDFNGGKVQHNEEYSTITLEKGKKMLITKK